MDPRSGDYVGYPYCDLFPAGQLVQQLEGFRCFRGDGSRAAAGICAAAFVVPGVFVRAEAHGHDARGGVLRVCDRLDNLSAGALLAAGSGGARGLCKRNEASDYGAPARDRTARDTAAARAIDRAGCSAGRTAALDAYGAGVGLYRERRAEKIAALEEISPLKTLDCFYVLHDPMDRPAADRLRKEIEQTGVKEGTNDSAAVVLLTNRTREEWLIHNAQQLPAKVITVVGTTIRLPERFEWLWRREWIDFRHWHMDRLDRKNGLLAVPEAVTGTRFPRPVRVAHHLLCSMGGLCMALPTLANPNETGEAQGIAAMALLIWHGVLGRRLLRRTVLERAFYRGWVIRVLLVVCLAAWTFGTALERGVSVFRAAPLLVFFAAWPVLWARNRPGLGFWFPSPGVPSLKNAANLSTQRNWQTVLWVLAWYVVWALALGLFVEES